ncbi:MAG TPA: hypothetical protein VD970_18150, partial [Acetobacteraceae bacterium]|nr:hypothetical protein [Acetobacteraceae bacterium]
RAPRDEFVYDNARGVIDDDVDGRSAEWFTATFQPNARLIANGAFARLISGLWGTMVVLTGPRVFSATRPGDDDLGNIVPGVSRQGAAPAAGSAGRLQARVDAAAARGRVIQRISFANRILELETEAGTLSVAATYTTAERFRGHLGGLGGNRMFVMLRERAEPYGLRVEGPYQALIDMRPTHDGEYVRVLGGQSVQERGILIHEAAHPGWVVGCIAPRPLGNRGVFQTRDANNPSAASTRELIHALRTHGGHRGQLFVL